MQEVTQLHGTEEILEIILSQVSQNDINGNEFMSNQENDFTQVKSFIT